MALRGRIGGFARAARQSPGKLIRARRDGLLENAKRLADDLPIEYVWTPSRTAMKAALRVVLGRPRVLEGDEDDGNDKEEDCGGVPPR